MHRIDTSTATGDGRFTEGDPLVPTPATVVSADWLNSVQEELVNTLSAAGIAPDKTNNAQLLAAIRHLVGTINTPYEALRKNLIGVPRYWRSTTLPANHVWANGDFVLFSDWPELKKVYDGGGFNGMLLAYNADNSTIANNLGKWRPNAANPTGLYVPNLSEQFFRAWGQGTSGAAGGYNAPGLPEIEGHFDGCDLLGDSQADWSGAFIRDGTLYGNVTVAVSGVGIELPTTFSARASNPLYGSSATVMPASINLPVILYLGIRA